MTVHAQREREIRPPEEGQYGRKFFVQLRAVFGRFRETDLQRAFDKAQPIQCAELVNDPGEWRTVAFFNEKRELGDWYRSSFEEVKSDLSVFIFKGTCRGEHGPVQLATKFPVTETVEAYNQGRIGLTEIDVNVNAPVRASFDLQTQAYSFDLPYLFLVSRQDDESLFSLAPPRLAERERYAPDVIDHWDCKSVTAENVSYQFLICRTTTQPRNPAVRNQNRSASFGASAFFILSDGKEASSSVKLVLDDAVDTGREVVDQSTNRVDVPPDAHVAADWEAPDSDEKLLDVVRDEFRVRFNAQKWTGRIGDSQALSGQQLTALGAFTPPAGADYCLWLPSASSANQLLSGNADELVTYVVKAHDADGQSATSISFNLSTPTGQHLGALQCFFPRASSAASVAFGRWTSTVGSNLTLEVRP